MQRQTSNCPNSRLKLKKFFGPGKSFIPSEVPTVRAVLQCGFLLLDNYFLDVHSSKKSEAKSQVIKDLAALILQQWYKSNAKFTSPVIITEVSLVQRLKRLWEKAESVCWGHVKANIKEKFLNLISKTNFLQEILTWDLYWKYHRL